MAIRRSTSKDKLKRLRMRSKSISLRKRIMARNHTEKAQLKLTRTGMELQQTMVVKMLGAKKRTKRAETQMS